MDCQPTPDLLSAGDFDLHGMLAALGAKAKQMGARRIVFDALDIVLSLLPDEVSRRRELYRLHQWVADLGLTCFITAKHGGDQATLLSGGSGQPFGFMQFMVDCAVMLNHPRRSRRLATQSASAEVPRLRLR